MIRFAIEGRGIWQWDIGDVIFVSGLNDVGNWQIHFALSGDDHNAYVVTPHETEEGVLCEIPNILLQTSGNLLVYAYNAAENKKYTETACLFRIKPREKPDDYVFMDNEVRVWEEVKKIAEAAVKTVNGISPDESGNVEVEGVESATTEETAEMLIDLDLLKAVKQSDGAILSVGNAILMW